MPITPLNPEPAYANGGPTGSAINATVGGGGVDIRGRDLKAGQEGSAAIPTFIRAVTPACPGNDANAGGPYDISCSYMTTFCQLRGEGDGPMTWVWRRPLDAEGKPAGRWRRVGYSCNEPLPDHDLSLADVRRAFRRVDFARPRLLSQPGGGWALVNFDTYYQVGWPEQGVRPQQVATVHLLGHEVAIRPNIVTYEYDYGDGEKARTDDPGGSYPDGVVRHAYRAVGEVTIGVTARYSADFSLDGGAFRGLDDTVDIAGPVRTLRVYQARAQLIPNPGEE
jgi:hypothetical protein